MPGNQEPAPDASASGSAAGKKNVKGTLFCIHGMWGGGHVWDRWRTAFENADYEVIAPTLPHHDVAPGDHPPAELGTTSLIDYAAFLEAEIRKLPSKPVIVGHSMGGLLAQILTARGLARAAVYCCPAPSAGWPAQRELLSPSVTRTLIGHMLLEAIWGRPQKLTFRQARYSSLNLLTEDEAREEYATWVHESGRVLWEIGLWYFDKRRAARVAFDRIDVPNLTLSGGRDRIVPKPVVDIAARRLARVGGDYKVYPEHSHWMIREPGHERVAADVIDWLDKLDG